MCIDFQIFGHFGNLMNSLKGSGGGHMKFLTFGTPLNKMKHPIVSPKNRIFDLDRLRDVGSNKF